MQNQPLHCHRRIIDFLCDNLVAALLHNVESFDLKMFIENYKTEMRFVCLCGACVAPWESNGVPRDGPRFDSRWELCKNLPSRPSQGTVNGGAVSK